MIIKQTTQAHTKIRLNNLEVIPSYLKNIYLLWQHSCLDFWVNECGCKTKTKKTSWFPVTQMTLFFLHHSTPFYPWGKKKKHGAFIRWHKGHWQKKRRIYYLFFFYPVFRNNFFFFFFWPHVFCIIYASNVHVSKYFNLTHQSLAGNLGHLHTATSARTAPLSNATSIIYQCIICLLHNRAAPCTKCLCVCLS